MKENVTRGYGVLETFLAKLRDKIANRRIPEKHRDGRILDIGCGTYPLFLLGTRFKKKYGLDQFKYSRSELADLPKNISLQTFDLGKKRKLPFPSKYFKVVTMLAVFEHISPPLLPHLISEIHRVLVPGGVFFMTTPTPWADALLRIMAKVNLVSPDEIEDHKDVYTGRKIRRILAAAGMDRSKMEFGYFEFFLNNWGRIEK